MRSHKSGFPNSLLASQLLRLKNRPTSAPALGMEYVTPSPVFEFASPVHQEPSQQSIEDQTFDAPVPQTVEEQLVAVAPTPATTDVTFPLENFGEACKMLGLKQVDLREAKLVLQRLELYPAKSGQTRDAEAASKAKQADESAQALVENVLRELDTFRALRPPMTASDALFEYKTLRRPRGKTVAQTLTSLLLSDFVQHLLLHYYRRVGDC